MERGVEYRVLYFTHHGESRTRNLCSLTHFVVLGGLFFIGEKSLLGCVQLLHYLL
jgi:hypothetical protein